MVSRPRLLRAGWTGPAVVDEHERDCVDGRVQRAVCDPRRHPSTGPQSDACARPRHEDRVADVPIAKPDNYRQALMGASGRIDRNRVTEGPYVIRSVPYAACAFEQAVSSV